MRAHTAGWGFTKGGLILAIVASVALTGCAPTETATKPVRAPAMKHLTIITPHNAKIREAFAEGFSTWHLAQRGTPVDIQWITRGTPQCVEYINRLFTGTAEDRRQVTPDLMFG
ncbi:MAG: hypothetical protein H6817_12080, partial [Phycisphaerales bacterium]|nr:hypothetical protein [Phycisphaerales bacterium]